jgi:SAM-dependent methyltransferase
MLQKTWQIISEFDTIAYQKIRDNVRLFLKNQSQILDNENTLLLDIAPQVHAGAKEFFTKSKIYTADIDTSSGADYIIDICRNNTELIPNETFDIVVCTEVLEHTLHPFKAIDEIKRILKTGGILLLTTPFDFRIHGPLPDCWRFTEHGLKVLLADFESSTIEALENGSRFLMPFHYTTVARKS